MMENKPREETFSPCLGGCGTKHADSLRAFEPYCGVCGTNKSGSVPADLGPVVKQLSAELAQAKADLAKAHMNEAHEHAASMDYALDAGARNAARVAHYEKLADTWKARAERAEAEIKRLKALPPADEGKCDCGHNTYWTSHYGFCMACRAERAEAEVATMKQELDDARDIECDLGHEGECCLEYNGVGSRYWRDEAKDCAKRLLKSEALAKEQERVIAVAKTLRTYYGGMTNGVYGDLWAALDALTPEPREKGR